MFPGAALGGTVTTAGGDPFVPGNGCGRGVNVVTVTSSPGTIEFTEAGPQSMGGPGGSCSQPDPQVVSCNAMGMTGLKLHGGNLDDRLTNQTYLPIRGFSDGGQDGLRGGSESDTLLGREPTACSAATATAPTTVGRAMTGSASTARSASARPQAPATTYYAAGRGTTRSVRAPVLRSETPTRSAAATDSTPSATPRA